MFLVRVQEWMPSTWGREQHTPRSKKTSKARSGVVVVRSLRDTGAPHWGSQEFDELKTCHQARQQKSDVRLQMLSFFFVCSWKATLGVGSWMGSLRWKCLALRNVQSECWSFLVPADRSLAAVTKYADTHTRSHAVLLPPESGAVSNATVTCPE